MSQVIYCFGAGTVLGEMSYSMETLLTALNVDPYVMTIFNVCHSNGGVNPVPMGDSGSLMTTTRDQIIARSRLLVLVTFLLKNQAPLIRLTCM